MLSSRIVNSEIRTPTYGKLEDKENTENSRIKEVKVSGNLMDLVGC